MSKPFNAFGVQRREQNARDLPAIAGPTDERDCDATTPVTPEKGRVR